MDDAIALLIVCISICLVVFIFVVSLVIHDQNEYDFKFQKCLAIQTCDKHLCLANLTGSSFQTDNYLELYEQCEARHGTVNTT